MTDNKLNLNRIPYPVWFFLILLNLVLIVVVVTPILQKQSISKADVELQTTTITPSSPPTSTIDEPTIQETPAPSVIVSTDFKYDLLFLISFYKDQQNHIYSYIPGENQFIRFFDGPYEDMDPAYNVKTNKIAYSGKKNGYWDIYVYDLETREEIRITDSAAYDGKPAWSPDGEFLAYTSYLSGNLDIFIQSINDLDSPPIQLTDDPAADFSPVWSPNGREIAFVSARSGNQEIWLAQLNTVVDRFSNLSNRPDFQDSNPGWFPESEQVIWSGEKEGDKQILQTDITKKPWESIAISKGKFGQVLNDYLITIHENANQSFLSIQDYQSKQYLSFPIEIPGSVEGFQVLALSQTHPNLLADLQSNSFVSINENNNLDENNIQNNLNRENITFLSDVNAPYPYMNESVISAFDLLRIDTANIIGWDFLSDLEEAYLPLTNPAEPGLQENWLYTGRAFKFNPLTLYADLATIIKEEHNGMTYWRVYLKTRYQDGSQGKPLMQTPWKLDARYQNDPNAYEAGGYYDQIPEGYWIDFTQIAKDHLWDRQPSLPNWRQYFNGALFNLFTFTNGLDWFQAMQQIYPVESIKSPTPIPSITSTPTFTPTIRFFRSPTATLTPTSTLIPTRRPTWTPIP
ncbi:MAG: hypothetical protein CL609_12255 [Anaerolineaceae bacterium]|nr:hypothetical protein [Anaerolineaceae bacterium]